MSKSQFRMYSIGIVVENKPAGTDFILVTPMEELSIQESGNIKEAGNDFKGDKGSISPTNFKTEHTSKNYVRAKWSSIGSGNRTSAPDVVGGETVILYKYGNVDEYFWDEYGREPSLRRLEDVLYSYSNKSGGIGSESYDKESSYWVQVSTKDKFIHIHTADNDGEACKYDLHIDTKLGVFTISDSLGNKAVMDSVGGIHTTEMNTEIIRKAPKITDISNEHTVQTADYMNQASGSIVNDAGNMVNLSRGAIENTASEVKNKTSLVTNEGNVHTKGTDKADGGHV